MNEKVNIENKFRCNLCDKYYASASSLCNHNKKFHNEQNNTLIIHDNTLDNTFIIPDKKYKCHTCEKTFNNFQNRWKHEKICKQKVDDTKNNQKLEELEKTINELKVELELNKHYAKNITNNTINNNINNGTIINNVVKFGELSYDAIFNDKQIRKILKCKHKALEESIKQTHFNKDHPELNNVFITNMRDNLAHVYDGTTIKAMPKGEVINELIDMHTAELTIALEKQKTKLKDYDAQKVEELLKKLETNTKFIDENENKTYANHKTYKTEQIKIMVYNETDLARLKQLLSGTIKEHKLYVDIDITTED